MEYEGKCKEIHQEVFCPKRIEGGIYRDTYEGNTPSGLPFLMPNKRRKKRRRRRRRRKRRMRSGAEKILSTGISHEGREESFTLMLTC